MLDIEKLNSNRIVIPTLESEYEVTSSIGQDLSNRVVSLFFLLLVNEPIKRYNCLKNPIEIYIFLVSNVFKTL